MASVCYIIYLYSKMYISMKYKNQIQLEDSGVTKSSSELNKPPKSSLYLFGNNCQTLFLIKRCDFFFFLNPKEGFDLVYLDLVAMLSLVALV